MLNAHAKEYRAKEAESLEQANQANDEDLKHLHETIAQQWRLLADEIEIGPANARSGNQAVTLANSTALEPSIDGAPSTPPARRVETPLEWLLSCWFGGNLDGKPK
jgi:hypothetical protein